MNNDKIDRLRKIILNKSKVDKFIEHLGDIGEKIGSSDRHKIDYYKDIPKIFDKTIEKLKEVNLLSTHSFKRILSDVQAVVTDDIMDTKIKMHSKKKKYYAAAEKVSSGTNLKKHYEQQIENINKVLKDYTDIMQNHFSDAIDLAKSAGTATEKMYIGKNGLINQILIDLNSMADDKSFLEKKFISQSINDDKLKPEDAEKKLESAVKGLRIVAINSVCDSLNTAMKHYIIEDMLNKIVFGDKGRE